ncbi:Oligopeptide ABC transporter, periplasmic oligopeptide-binding protein OppA [Lachnospiraceae bacterium TWA4]|nr:Oligopeptide ABC transporter, periplasmic oligopeptide-binding protein OppA [Lachnospiraceae bacterium TWA4]
MKKRNQVVAFLLAGTMVAGLLGGCGSSTGSNSTAASTEAGKTTSTDTPLVVAEDDFSEKFSPFFVQSVPDQRLTDFTQVALIGNDRSGEIIMNGINGEDKEYNGTTYHYNGLADTSIEENKDGSITYDFKLREDVTFSDGEKLTADDLIFSMYALIDPSYDGSSSLYALPIRGLEAYRSGSEVLYTLMLKNGAENKDFKYYTEDQQKKFFETDLPAAGEAWAKSIVDYCVANGYIEKESVKDAMEAWGFTGAKDDATTADFFKAVVEKYENDYQVASEKESAESSLFDFLDDSYKVTVETGDSADYVEGIEKVGDYEVKVTLDEIDASAIYQLGVQVSPMHYYGDTSKYDYANHKFGFEKGDLSSVREKTSTPMGAGPYKFVKYENKIAYLEANENYFLGAPKIKNLQLKATGEPDKTPGVLQGAADIADPSMSKSTLEQISKENSNKEISGDKLTTVLTDYNGYGYIGINSNNVSVGGDGSTDASKNLRKAIATVISVYRDVTIESYYGDAAEVINYPISNTSWAAPKKSDADYKVAFSTDVKGNEIYKDGMTEDEKYAAALKAALGYLEAAGYKVADGKVTEAPKGAKLTYEVMIPGNGSGDHPSFGILTAASNALKTIGFELKINDLADSSKLWAALDAETAEIWCAAWQATIDPDMFQIYHSKGGDSHKYAILSPELDKMVMDAKTNTDQTYRKAKYKECLDFIVDYAVEIPIYQRQQGFIYSTERVNVDTLCPDQTTYYNWMAEIETLEMK